MSRKLEEDGQWSEWTEMPNNGMMDMFEINGRVYGFHRQSKYAYELEWTGDNDITFAPIVSIFIFNCCQIWLNEIF